MAYVAPTRRDSMQRTLGLCVQIVVPDVKACERWRRHVDGACEGARGCGVNAVEAQIKGAEA